MSLQFQINVTMLTNNAESIVVTVSMRVPYCPLVFSRFYDT